jgi:LacI family transcriptional regulator
MTIPPKVVLLIESSRASGRALLCGIANYAYHNGPWSFCWEPRGLEKRRPLPRAVEADGIILRDFEYLADTVARELPAVVIGHQQAEFPGLVNVVVDSDSVGRMGAEHLLQCGFKHFAFCGYTKTPLNNSGWSEMRSQAFGERICEAGFSSPSQYLLSMGEWADDLNRIAEWLRALPKPVGVMACNDDCGQRVMEACKLAGLTVPDVVGVVGADNDEVVCGLTDPPLSSIAINFERAGYAAARALDQWMRGSQDFERRIIAPATHVAARRSTDFVAAEDPNLAKALRFIRDQVRAGISVDEVARSAGTSRRALEKRFRRLLGRSILQEIRRVRTDHIGRLLVETQLTVGQIADQLGFADTQHIARYFRAGKKTSPLNYRKTHASHAVRSQNGVCFSQTGADSEGVSDLRFLYDPPSRVNLPYEKNVCCA